MNIEKPSQQQTKVFCIWPYKYFHIVTYVFKSQIFIVQDREQRWTVVLQMLRSMWVSPKSREYFNSIFSTETVWSNWLQCFPGRTAYIVKSMQRWAIFKLH